MLHTDLRSLIRTAYRPDPYRTAGIVFAEEADRHHPLNLNPAVGNAGAAREAQFNCAAQLLRASPNG